MGKSEGQSWQNFKAKRRDRGKKGVLGTLCSWVFIPVVCTVGGALTAIFCVSQLYRHRTHLDYEFFLPALIVGSILGFLFGLRVIIRTQIDLHKEEEE